MAFLIVPVAMLQSAAIEFGPPAAGGPTWLAGGFGATIGANEKSPDAPGFSV